MVRLVLRVQPSSWAAYNAVRTLTAQYVTMHQILHKFTLAVAVPTGMPCRTVRANSAT